jgi:flagellar basal body-associated protein FliL
MTETTSEIKTKINAKSKKSSGYITLMVLMLMAGMAGGIYGFSFGKKSLEGVNLMPLGSSNSNKVIPKPPKPPKP